MRFLFIYCNFGIRGEILGGVKLVLNYRDGLGYGGQMQRSVLGLGVLPKLASLVARSWGSA